MATLDTMAENIELFMILRAEIPSMLKRSPALLGESGRAEGSAKDRMQNLGGCCACYSPSISQLKGRLRPQGAGLRHQFGVSNVNRAGLQILSDVIVVLCDAHQLVLKVAIRGALGQPTRPFGLISVVRRLVHSGPTAL